MDENKKQKNANKIIVIVVAVLLVFGYIRITNLNTDVQTLRTENSRLSAEIQNLRNEINAIYTNVDKQLKEQASLVSGIDFTLGNPNSDMKNISLALTVIPKTITDDMQLFVTADGNTVPLARNGNEFTGAVDVGLFADYDHYPLLTIQTAEETKTEYLENIHISYLFSNYLPTLQADMTTSSRFRDGKLQLDATFRIATKSVYGTAPVTFTSFTLVEDVNGKEVSRKDITDEVQNAGDVYNTQYNKTFEVESGDELKIYVIAEDSLGYIHKTLAHYWKKSADIGENAIAETVFGGEMILDKDGNVLYGEKVLWG